MDRFNVIVGLFASVVSACLTTAQAGSITAAEIAPQPFGPAFPALDGWATGAWWKDSAATTAQPDVKGGRPFAVDVPRGDVIAFALYTVTVRPESRGTLKLSAQLFPLKPSEAREARLEIRRGDAWVEAARAQVHYPGWDVNFRVAGWDSSRDWPYRVRHGDEAIFEGLIRRDPADKPEITVAVMSCNSSRTTGARDELVTGLRKADPDLLFFAGDQTYRHTQHTVGWIEFGLQFRDVIRDRPTVTIPDDHDVGHGNLWGAGGKQATRKDGADGGYFYPADYVNMVQRQQTWHLPDPVDPAPVGQGIGVFFTRLVLGGLDCAILEDRKFKTGPLGAIPQMGPRPDHITDPTYDRASIDKPGLELLGPRQVAWLERWSRDWQGVRAKTALSATAFAGAVHLHGSPDNRLLADLDCNGWPQSGRNQALKLLKAAHASHLCGDQHLAVVMKHGIERHGDGPWSFTSPALVNTIYGRWWHPLDERPGANPVPGSPLPWTGDYEDGLGNTISIVAYANPEDVKDEKKRGDGYGIARFDFTKDTITFECWPRFPSVGADGSARQYPGWPVTVPLERPAPAEKPAAAVGASTAPAQPNVIVVLVDDMGWRDLSCQGSPYFETPHIDRLAASGMRFTHGYSACTVCSPTRAAMLMGQYPARLHITDWIPGHQRPHAKLSIPDWQKFLPLETVTVAERLQSAGYATASIGKWHLGGDAYFPEHQGFDRNIGGSDRGQPPSSFSPYKIPTLPDGPVGEYLTDREAAEAVSFIEAHRDRPFFLYLPHYAVHTPIQAKPAVKAKYAAKDAGGLAVNNAGYAAMVESVDDALGTILAALDRLGIRDRTAIVFTSDNGGLVSSTDNAPARAGKGSAYEGGVRVPFIVSWPGVTRPGTTSAEPVITPDIPATILDLTGAGAEPGQPLDGVSLAPALRGEPLGRDALYWHYPHYHPGGATPHSAVRAGDWRLVRFCEDGRRELYNLRADEGETTDLAAREPDRVTDLTEKLDAWLASVGAQLPTPNPAHDPARDTTARRPKRGRHDTQPAVQKTPNVLFLIADDASCHFGCYGCGWARTPAVDRLARDGLVFDNAYVPTSKCAPCRAAILTGRNPWQLEAAANHWPTFPPEYRAFTEVLAATGVACGGAGKVWGPGVAQTAGGDKRTWGLATVRRGKGSDAGAGFQAFLATRKPGQPFFYWFGSTNPHRKYEPDAGLAAGKKPTDIDRVPACWPDTDIVRRDMLDYATEIEAFDAEVGSLLAALDAAGEAENTVVIVTSDHGMPFPRIKGHTFDLAHRVPLVMRWPAGIVHPGRHVEAFVSAIDFAPTILDLERVDGVAGGMRPIMGASLADLLRDAPAHPRDRVILGRERNDVRCRPGTESGLGYPARAIRRGNLFYVHNFAPDRWPCGDPDLGLADTDAGPTKTLIEAVGEGDHFWQLCFGKRPADELYDLATDPDCVKNLAADPARSREVRRLKEELFAELTRQADPRLLGRGDAFDHYPSPQPVPGANPAPARPAPP
jgi:arylsulfatase A-like enzyme